MTAVPSDGLTEQALRSARRLVAQPAHLLSPVGRDLQDAAWELLQEHHAHMSPVPR